jgi:hypothetical protein
MPDSFSVNPFKNNFMNNIKSFAATGLVSGAMKLFLNGLIEKESGIMTLIFSFKRLILDKRLYSTPPFGFVK